MKRKIVQDLQYWEAKLKRDMARWEHILLYGSGDPFWPDGTGLWLKRNHIIHDIQHIKELGGDVSGYRIPPEMPDDYMANDRLIKGRAVPRVKEQLTLFGGA